MLGSRRPTERSAEQGCRFTALTSSLSLCRLAQLTADTFLPQASSLPHWVPVRQLAFPGIIVRRLMNGSRLMVLRGDLSERVFCLKAGKVFRRAACLSRLSRCHRSLAPGSPLCIPQPGTPLGDIWAQPPPPSPGLGPAWGLHAACLKPVLKSHLCVGTDSRFVPSGRLGLWSRPGGWSESPLAF